MIRVQIPRGFGRAFMLTPAECATVALQARISVLAAHMTPREIGPLMRDVRRRLDEADGNLDEALRRLRAESPYRRPGEPEQEL